MAIRQQMISSSIGRHRVRRHSFIRSSICRNGIKCLNDFTLMEINIIRKFKRIRNTELLNSTPNVCGQKCIWITDKSNKQHDGKRTSCFKPILTVSSTANGLQCLLLKKKSPIINGQFYSTKSRRTGTILKSCLPRKMPRYNFNFI